MGKDSSAAGSNIVLKVNPLLGSGNVLPDTTRGRCQGANTLNVFNNNYTQFSMSYLSSFFRWQCNQMYFSVRQM